VKRLSARNFTLAAGAFAALVTLSTAVVPFIPFAFRNSSLHVVVDATEALVAGLVAYLLVGRLRQSGRRGDLALIFALSLLSVTNLLLAVLPTDVRGGEELFIWMAIICRAVGATGFAVSAFIGDRKRRVEPRDAMKAAVAAPALVAAIILVLIPFAGSLPLGVELSRDPGATSELQIEGHPALLSLQLVGALMYLIAAAGFTRRAQVDNDDLMRWLGAGATLAAFARINFFLFPSLYSNYVYSGDLLRLGFYLFLLVGATREIVSYWESRAEAARLEERRRLARDLHDGLAQELVVVASQSRTLERSQRMSDPTFRQLTSAVDRAVGEARRAIAALTGSGDEPLHRAIQDVVEEVAMRTNGTVDADLDSEVNVPPAVREQLVRIVREAVTNASRHAQAGSIEVRLLRDGAVVLEVCDDGIGFELEKALAAEHSFGMIMMKERAEAIGGSLHISSTPGAGTTVRLELA
jgi:signal transduction histidine kinase